MSSTIWLCLILLVFSTSSYARPKASPDNPDDGPSEIPPEDRVNLHHSLKEVRDAASKMVKDVHGYVHQKFSSLVKKQLDVISRPLIKVVAPVFYIKDRLVSMGGTRKPSNQEDITSWCPTCLEANSFGRNDAKDPCEGVDSNCLEVNETLDAFTEKGSSASPFVTSQTEYSATVENQKTVKSEEVSTSEQTDEASEPYLVFSGVWGKPIKSLQTSENDNEFQDLQDFPDMSIDVRFGNDQGPLLGNLSLMGISSSEKSLPNIYITSNRPSNQFDEQEEYLTTECTLCLKGIPHIDHRSEGVSDSKYRESKTEKSAIKSDNNVLKML